MPTADYFGLEKLFYTLVESGPH